MQTGLDLVQFPTLVWYETDYSVYVMRQASRRSWRIGQTEPVKVVFMAYRNTLQADALTLVAKKLQSSLAVEGELPEDGLAAFGDDGDDLMLALARKIVAGEEEAGSVESVFEQARQVAAEAEALLVDDGWHAPEPAIVEAEVVTVGATAGDSPSDAPEPQRTLFSWAEFMAGEQDEPPKRKRRDEAPTLSLFEWALEREQEGALAA
ncbi:MAG: SWF/SNF helicase family protein [Gemmatimonadetes bacterium]|nr:SWF/SNF helicase family protein [Gemmatimonadota bacterium]